MFLGEVSPAQLSIRAKTGVREGLLLPLSCFLSLGEWPHICFNKPVCLCINQLSQLRHTDLEETYKGQLQPRLMEMTGERDREYEVQLSGTRLGGKG